MRYRTSLLVACTALVASPAAAQVNVGAQTGVGVNVPVGNTVDRVGSTVGRTVDNVDRNANRALDRTGNARLAVATRADVTAGAMVSDRDGRQLGTVQSVSGNSAVLVSGNHNLRVPISSLYRSANGLVMQTSRLQFNARARAQAKGNGRAEARQPAPRD